MTFDKIDQSETKAFRGTANIAIYRTAEPAGLTKKVISST